MGLRERERDSKFIEPQREYRKERNDFSKGYLTKWKNISTENEKLKSYSFLSFILFTFYSHSINSPEKLEIALPGSSEKQSTSTLSRPSIINLADFWNSDNSPFQWPNTILQKKACFCVNVFSSTTAPNTICRMVVASILEGEHNCWCIWRRDCKGLEITSCW